MSDNNQIEFPTIRRRIFSYAGYYFGAFIWVPIFQLPTMIMTAIGSAVNSTHMNVFTGIGSILSGALFLFAAWELSKEGMTFRHLFSGYKIVNAETGKPMNFFMLYVREVAVVISACLGFMKIIMPALLKRSVDSMTMDDNHHVVVRSGGNTFVSNQNLGQMRDAQMNANLKADAEKQFLSIAENGFMHDRIFKTVGIRASRKEALSSLFNGGKAPKAPSVEKQKAA